MDRVAVACTACYRWRMNCDLIFDVGFHKGEDTAFYLAKGFRVVAVEANPVLIEAGRERFSDAIASGRLVLVHAALAEEVGQERAFFISSFSDWSSLKQQLAERGKADSYEVTVSTTTLPALVETHGLPRFIKCDIEGYDVVCAAQLERLREKPLFASFEASDIEIFSWLKKAGYSGFQFTNQRIHDQRHWHTIEREGQAIRYRFQPAGQDAPLDCSGPFGLDLSDHKWIDFDSALARFQIFSGLQKMDPELGVGWLDVHARL